ncbi:MAG: VIT1/CCC1 family protein [Candidatus Caldarchaeum sp.]|nr:VIT1/CCC1 family protein [Candidatus Caldarchaeum sp.]
MDADYREFIDNEYKDHKVYSMLAQIEKNGDRKQLLQKLADIERSHSEFWWKYAPEHRPRISGLYLRLLAMIRVFFGVTFVVKMLENHEKKTMQKYLQMIQLLDQDNPERHSIERFIKEESELETSLVSSIDEAIVRYIGFVMLGLADAIIEVTGVQAGFLGVTNSALVAGLAGLIVGTAASISMGAAAFLQARQTPKEKAIVPGMLTGIIYFITVLFIASPYFLASDLTMAFGVSITISAVLVALFSFFVSIVQNRSFRKEFFINITLLASVILVTYTIGNMLGAYFGIKQLIT